MFLQEFYNIIAAQNSIVRYLICKLLASCTVEDISNFIKSEFNIDIRSNDKSFYKLDL